MEGLDHYAKEEISTEKNKLLRKSLNQKKQQVEELPKKKKNPSLRNSQTD